MRVLAILGFVLAWSMASPASAPIVSARVVDVSTGAPIGDAVVTFGSREVRTDAHGVFRIEATGTGPIAARAAGYERRRLPIESVRVDGASIHLKPIRVKALYLSMSGIATESVREPALRLADSSEANAVVIDIKGDRGLIAYRTANRLASQVGAQKTLTIKDLPGLVSDLHIRGLYVIARIVVFKDDPLATSQFQLAIKRQDGTLYRDREGLAWTDPFSRDVWNYNIAVAVEAARAGFDEVQFDDVRLPDATGLALPPPDNEAHRTAAIDGFLSAARDALRPFNVFTSADIFGDKCWNNDTGIGQQIEHMVGLVDYLSPMVYPPAHQAGRPGCRNLESNPYQIVRRSIEQVVAGTHVSTLRFRPWLQAFPDYAFGGVTFTRGEVRRQIEAAEDAGSSGWMLWNPRSRYSPADLTPSVDGTR